MSCPCHQPEKWNGMKQVSAPTRSVTCALTLSFAPEGVLTQTYSLLRMPRSAAVLGLISTKLSCCSSASHGLERVSSPPPSYSTRRPLVRMSGNFSCALSAIAFCCSLLNLVGRRHSTLTSTCVGHLATRAGLGEYSGSQCGTTPSGKFQTTARPLPWPKRWPPGFNVTRSVPPHPSRFQLLPLAPPTPA